MAFNSSKKFDSEDYTDYSSSPASTSSFFGRTMKIEGEVSSDENLTIEGKIIGQLHVSKTLNIGKEGHVSGDITAAVVRISGEAEGRVVASEKLEISSQGIYKGDIKADKIVIAEGAVVKGTINYGENEIKKPIIAEKPTPEKTEELKESTEAIPVKEEEKKENIEAEEEKELKEENTTAEDTNTDKDDKKGNGFKNGKNKHKYSGFKK